MIDSNAPELKATREEIQRDRDNARKISLFLLQNKINPIQAISAFQVILSSKGSELEPEMFMELYKSFTHNVLQYYKYFRDIQAQNRK